MSNILEKLTEGTVTKNLLKESQAVVSKWERSGLLEGLKSELQKRNLSVLLENQAKELLRESNVMSSGEVQGFASVAFPIVRRVFGGLIANEIVSVQPMSLPAGLVFFLDFKRGTNTGLAGDRTFSTTESVFGDRVGSQITGGVRVDGEAAGNTERGYYNLKQGYGSATGSTNAVASSGFVLLCNPVDLNNTTQVRTNGRYFRNDPDIVAETTKVALVLRTTASVSNLGTQWDLVKLQDLASISIATGAAGVDSFSTSPISASLVRRLTRIVEGAGLLSHADILGEKYLETVWLATSASATGSLLNATASCTLAKAVRGTYPAAIGAPLYGASFIDGNISVVYPTQDRISSVGNNSLGAVAGASPWNLENNDKLSEIDIKVDSFSVVTKTRKLKARWSPELSQDLNTWHNLDAEAELTSILSETIAQDIDAEILGDLLKGAVAGTYFWSRRPGQFVNRKTGAATDNTTSPPDFTGNVSMWYETLIETVNDVSAQIHRKTLRGGANFLVTSPEVANILEMTAGFRASVTHDDNKGTAGAVNLGSVSKKWDIWVDPRFPRNVILVGRKGSGFLESGYVYAPYVPLQTTPTIFDPEDFTPRKAVLTRYGAIMVRPDMFGLVIVADLEG